MSLVFEQKKFLHTCPKCDTYNSYSKLFHKRRENMEQKQPPPKFIFGIENEFGIVWPGMSRVEYGRGCNDALALSNDSAIAAKLFIFFFINHFLKPNPFCCLGKKNSESLSVASILEQTLFWLAPNGAKVHADSEHPEYATPECEDPYSAALFNKAGERLLEIVLRALNQKLARTSIDDFVKNVLRVPEFLMKEGACARTDNLGPIMMQKTTSDLSGNHFGTHENYLCARKKILTDNTSQLSRFDKIRINMLPFFATRQIFSGSGGFWKAAEDPSKPYRYVISPRSLQLQNVLSPNSTLNFLACISTKDETWLENSEYFRFHLTACDALMSEFATALSIGTTSIVLSMIQDDFLNEQIVFEWERETLPAAESQDEADWKQKTLNCFWEISLKFAHDRNIEILLKDGPHTPVAIQQKYLNLAKTYFKTVREPIWWEKRILEEWEFVLNLLEKNSPELDKYVEWSSKLTLLKSVWNKHAGSARPMLDENGLTDSKIWQQKIQRPKTKKEETIGNILLTAFLQYSDISRKRSIYKLLAKQGKVKRLFTDFEIRQAIRFPPLTRASLREYARNFAAKRGLGYQGHEWNSITLIGKNYRHQFFKEIPPFGGDDLFNEILRFEKWFDEIKDDINNPSPPPPNPYSVPVADG